MLIEGRAWRFGANVNTDLIFPKMYFRASYAPGEMARHLMDGLDPAFAARVRPGDVVVAGRNFGCGSSREEAAAAMKEAGIGAVVAPSFSRLFTRNSINFGLPVITLPDIEAVVADGDPVRIDLATSTLSNVATGATRPFPPFAAEALAMMRDGGIKAYTRRILAERRAAAR